MHSSIGMSRDDLDKADSRERMALTLIPFVCQLHFGMGLPSNTMRVAALAITAISETTSAIHSQAQ